MAHHVPAPQPVGQDLILPPAPGLPPFDAVPRPRVARDGDYQYLSIQPWHQSRMVAQFTQRPPTNLEYSAYGPINRLLNDQFLSAWKFMVKPQGVLRKQLLDDTLAKMGNHTSNGGLGGAPELIPDFIIAKSSPTLTGDIILAIVEVKRPAETSTGHAGVKQLGEIQIISYLSKAALEPVVAKHLYGFLVIGNEVTTYWLDTQNYRHPPDGNRAGIQPIEVGIASTDGPKFKDQLFAMAWSYRGNATLNWFPEDEAQEMMPEDDAQEMMMDVV